MHQRRTNSSEELLPHHKASHTAKFQAGLRHKLVRIVKLWNLRYPLLLPIFAILAIVMLVSLTLISESTSIVRNATTRTANHLEMLIREGFPTEQDQDMLLERMREFKDDHVIKAIQWMTRSKQEATLQRYALAMLYFATGGDHSWTKCSHTEAKCEQANKVSVLSRGSECDWFGVTCDEEATTVIRIAWTDNGLTMHEWPPELSLLSSLELLWWSGNKHVKGTIPTWISCMSNLKSLALHDTGLHGTVPHELYSLQILESLRIYNTKLTGTLSSDIGNLTKLSWLWLHGNSLTGSMPSELGLLTNLNGLTVYNNDFENSQHPPKEVCQLHIEELWTDCLEEVGGVEAECDCCTKCFTNVE